MKVKINNLLRHLNVQVNRNITIDPEKEFNSHLSDELKARQLFLDHYGIKVLLDVGANTGQYASLMRSIGYQGKIISFEPLSSAFEELKIKVDSDHNWQGENFALGSIEEQAKIHIAGNSYSSSLLDILPSHIDFDANSKYIAEETIKIKRLDDIYHLYCQPNDVVMLKIDTQGFEKNVLLGAKNSLLSITLLQLEISIQPLYENEVLFVEMVNFLQEIGFDLFTLENGIRDPKTGKLLQVDGIFLNRKKNNSIDL